MAIVIQDDQISLKKYRPKCNPTHFWSKLKRNFYRGKEKPEIWAIFGVFENTSQKKQPPNLENSPNLVTPNITKDGLGYNLGDFVTKHLVTLREIEADVGEKSNIAETQWGRFEFKRA
jgi:hypothetical protein